MSSQHAFTGRGKPNNHTPSPTTPIPSGTAITRAINQTAIGHDGNPC